MPEPLQIKVCGLTSEADAALAERLGAQYLGFILHPKSPRFVSLADATAIANQFPRRQRVAVSVEPDADSLEAQLRAGFDRFQVHYRHDLPLGQLSVWSRIVGRQRLWLAPKLPPEIELSQQALSLAETVLFDTYQSSGYGGSGRISDWPKFARSLKAHPENTWVLAGGLSADNVAEAMRATGARFVDVNSGAESSPGKKDPAKLAAFFEAARLAG